jgi:hypothetical protein
MGNFLTGFADSTQNRKKKWSEHQRKTNKIEKKKKKKRTNEQTN